MTITMLMLLIGILMVYAGWKGKSLVRLVRGDNS